MNKCAKCHTETTKTLTYGGGAKKLYGGGICDTCVTQGALK